MLLEQEVDAEVRRGTDLSSKLKNSTGWESGGNGTNITGFSAIPSYYRTDVGTWSIIYDYVG